MILIGIVVTLGAGLGAGLGTGLNSDYTLYKDIKIGNLMANLQVGVL